MTTGAIAGKYTRADLGMRTPRSRSLSIRPQAGGSTLHWGGPGSTINSHQTCIAIWRGWQDFHMGPERGWVDIAYTMGFCQHGWVFPGRGYGVRTAAQGTNDGNDRSYAFVHINEADKDPTAEALAAAAWLVEDAREHGRAGREVWAHWDWHETDCPGKVVAALSRVLDLHDITIKVTIEEDDMPTADEVAKAVWSTPVPTGELGSDKKPLTMQYVVMRAYQAAGRIEKLEQDEAAEDAVQLKP